MNNVGVARYNRAPTRLKLHALWLFAGISFFSYQLCVLTYTRVQPKREEQIYYILNREYPDGNIPADVLEQVQRFREAREGLSLQVALATPTPGQFQAKLMPEYDDTKLGALRK